MKRIDLTNKKFGRLTALKPVGKNKQGNVVWECLCDCGEICKIRTGDLRSGNTKSCGCYKIEQTIERFTIHGKSKTIEHNLWSGMVQRCYDKKSSAYYKYGARGIRVCDRWKR